MILAIISYTVALSVLALIIGFSPILYGMMVRLSADKNDRRASVWLVAGVIVGIVCMFALGGSIALGIESLQNTIDRDGVVRYALLGLVGLLGMVYIARQRMTNRATESHRKYGTRGTVQNLPLFLFAAVRTLTSVSGLTAVVLISGAMTSRSIPWFITFAVVLPFICLVATLPFIVLARGSEWQAALYEYVAKRAARVRDAVGLHEGAVQGIALLLCIGLLMYALIGLLSR